MSKDAYLSLEFDILSHCHIQLVGAALMSIGSQTHYVLVTRRITDADGVLEVFYRPADDYFEAQS